MNKFLAVFVLTLTASFSAFSATAYWTGEVEFGSTVTGKSAYRCRYEVYGNYFWRVFTNGSTCPSSIEVE